MKWKFDTSLLYKVSNNSESMLGVPPWPVRLRSLSFSTPPYRAANSWQLIFLGLLAYSFSISNNSCEQMKTPLPSESSIRGGSPGEPSAFLHNSSPNLSETVEPTAALFSSPQFSFVCKISSLEAWDDSVLHPDLSCFSAVGAAGECKFCWVTKGEAKLASTGCSIVPWKFSAETPS